MIFARGTSTKAQRALETVCEANGLPVEPGRVPDEVRIDGIDEPKLRLLMQDALDAMPRSQYNPRIDQILLNGNSVWSLKAIRTDARKVKQKGSAQGLSEYLYGFMHLNYTIAHYNRHGWAAEYPTYDDVRSVVRRGGEIAGGPPRCKTDVLRIQAEVFGVDVAP
jgi:hypothetical protein